MEPDPVGRGGSDQLLADLRPSSHSLPPGATSHIADLHPSQVAQVSALQRKVLDINTLPM